MKAANILYSKHAGFRYFDTFVLFTNICAG